MQLSYKTKWQFDYMALRWMVFNISKKLHSTLTPTGMEASTACSMGSVPDPFFLPQYKRKSGLAMRDYLRAAPMKLQSIKTFSVIADKL